MCLDVDCGALIVASGLHSPSPQPPYHPKGGVIVVVYHSALEAAALVEHTYRNIRDVDKEAKRRRLLVQQPDQAASQVLSPKPGSNSASLAPSTPIRSALQSPLRAGTPSSQAPAQGSPAVAAVPGVRPALATPNSWAQVPAQPPRQLGPAPAPALPATVVPKAPLQPVGPRGRGLIELEEDEENAETEKKDKKENKENNEKKEKKRKKKKPFTQTAMDTVLRETEESEQGFWSLAGENMIVDALTALDKVQLVERTGRT